MSIHEAAAFLGLSELTLRRYVSQSKLPSKRVGLKRRFFDKGELLIWIEEMSTREPKKKKGRLQG